MRWLIKRLVVVYLGLIFNFVSLHVFVKIMPYQFIRGFAAQDSVIFAKKSLFSLKKHVKNEKTVQNPLTLTKR